MTKIHLENNCLRKIICHVFLDKNAIEICRRNIFRCSQVVCSFPHLCLFDLFDSIAQFVKLLSCLRHTRNSLLRCVLFFKKRKVFNREKMGCNLELPFSEGKKWQIHKKVNFFRSCSLLLLSKVPVLVKCVRVRGVR